MSEGKNFELKVGIFVAIGVVLFFIVVFSIGDISLVKKGYRLRTSFSFIDGVAQSAPVRYAGVDIGYVERIGIYFDENEKKSKVMVTIYVNNPERKIEKDAVCTINTLGLLGEKYIEIYPGTTAAGCTEENGILKAEDPVMMRNVTDAFNKLAQSAGDIMNNIKEGKGTVGKLLTSDEIYNDMRDFVADIKAHPWKLLSKPRGE